MLIKCFQDLENTIVLTMLWPDLSMVSVFVYQGGAPCLIGHNVWIISAGDQWTGTPGAPGLRWSGPRLWSLAPRALTWRGWGRGDTCHVTCQASDNTEMDGAQWRGCECGQEMIITQPIV